MATLLPYLQGARCYWDHTCNVITVFVLQLQEAHAELKALRSDNGATAAAAHKARKRALQDCEAAIGEYDAELGARQKEYEQALTAYNELQEQIRVRAGGQGVRG